MDGGDQRSRLWSLVDDAIARWRSGEAPDAAAFFARHPEIGSRKSLALDLIHEELNLRREAGDTVVASTFVARFPAYRSSVVRMLQVENYGAAHPQFAEALAESLWPQPGQDFQGFEIVEPLGRGAMARVYLARETDMGRRPVVIKVSQYGGHEAHLLGKLEHDNIVAAHSVKHDDETGLTVICMPLLGTATGLDLLDAAFKRGEPPASAEVIGQTARRYQPAEVVNEENLKEALPFGRWSYIEGVVWTGQQLAEGLAAANSLGVVHRDIKPSNVLLAWSGRPMLLDFNLSSGEDQASDRIGGTIAYMAPERIDMLLDEDVIREEGLDPRPDLFSLGALLYELLTGRLPAQPMDAEGSDEAALARWRDIRKQPVVPPSHLNPAVDPAIDEIILRCLTVDPARRYATAADVAADLRAYLLPSARAARWARRNRRRLLVAAAAAAVALASGGAYWAALPPAHEVHYQEGLRLYAAGEYAAAAQAFSKSLKDEPKSVKALFGRGQSYYRLRDYKAGCNDFAAAVQLDKRALFWFCAGCCALHNGTGADYLHNAASAGYDPAAVRCNLGLNEEIRGNRHFAIVEYNNAIAANPQLQQAYLERAYARMNDVTVPGQPANSESLTQALKDIRQAVKLGPESRRLYHVAARLHAISGATNESDKRDAIEYLRRCLAEGGDPAKLRADLYLGSLFREIEPVDELVREPEVIAAPDPPRGVLPPATADLAELSGR